jgi:hypothetical protein
MLTGRGLKRDGSAQRLDWDDKGESRRVMNACQA